MMDTMTRETALARLVQQVHESGLSFREMSARAARAGHTISHAQLAAYAADTVTKAPTDVQIYALAAALSMGYEEVRGAVFQQFYGYTPRELKNRKGQRIVAALPPDLSQEDEENLAKMVELWLQRRNHHEK